MHSPWDVFIGYVFVGYMILSIASSLLIIGYGLHKLVRAIKDRHQE